jgi:hypothetical protein
MDFRKDLAYLGHCLALHYQCHPASLPSAVFFGALLLEMISLPATACPVIHIIEAHSDTRGIESEE